MNWYTYNSPLTDTMAVDSDNMLIITISAISLSQRGVRKLPQGADFLFKITWQIWSIKTMALRSKTSIAPWIIPRTAINLRFSSSACITRNITTDPKYNGTNKTYEYPGWTIFFRRWVQNRKITLKTTSERGEKSAIRSFPCSVCLLYIG